MHVQARVLRQRLPAVLGGLQPSLKPEPSDWDSEVRGGRHSGITISGSLVPVVQLILDSGA